jgi:hypothetical protein
MTVVTKFLEQAAHYIDKNSAAIVEKLTDEQFAFLVSATEDLTDGGNEPGIDSSLVRTHETLIDFDTSRSENWAERGARKDINVGVAAVKYEKVQVLKGQPRCDFIVVDLGDYRIVVK